MFDVDDKYRIVNAIYAEWVRTHWQTPDIENFFRFISLHNTTGRKLVIPATGEEFDYKTIERYLIWYIASYVHYSTTFERNLPDHYFEFAESLKGYGERYSVLTFNYDLVLEDAILDSDVGGLNYGLGYFEDLPEFCAPKGIPVLKMHGSLNWQKCDECGDYVISEDSLNHVFRRERCGGRCDGMLSPVIVPPVPDKAQYLGAKNQIWAKALDQLTNADELVILGYSMPAIDESALALIRDAITTNTDLTVDIVNPGLEVISAVGNRLGLGDLGSEQDPGQYMAVPLDFKRYVDEFISER